MFGMSRDKCGAAAVAGFMKTVELLQPKDLDVVAMLSFVRVNPLKCIEDILIFFIFCFCFCFSPFRYAILLAATHTSPMKSSKLILEFMSKSGTLMPRVEWCVCDTVPLFVEVQHLRMTLGSLSLPLVVFFFWFSFSLFPPPFLSRFWFSLPSFH